MEHIYTLKVKRQFDPRGQYPSERRYSASTVFGFAWVHLALACTSFLLTCLALYNPTIQNSNIDNKLVNQNNFPYPILSNSETFISTFESDNTTDSEGSNLLPSENEDYNSTSQSNSEDSGSTSKKHTKYSFKSDDFDGYNTSLIVAPSLLALGAFVAGFAAVLASRKWYVDHSITWFFLSSILSTILSVVALCMIAMWVATISKSGLNFCDYFTNSNLFNKVHIELDDPNSQEESLGNKTLYYIIKVPLEELKAHKIPLLGEDTKQSQTRKVLSVNILIAASVEIIWSLLSLKIAWTGMRSNYPDDEALNSRRNGGTVHVVTEIKGNNTRHLPKNTKILPPKPDLIEHYPKNNKIKKYFENQQENGGFFLHTNQNENGLLVVGGINDKPSDFSRRESSSEYRERMLNFLNKCATSDGMDAPESCPGFDPASLSTSDIVVSTPASPVVNDDETKSVAIQNNDDANNKKANRLSTISWGDIHDHPIYDQNTLTLDLEKMVFWKLGKKPENTFAESDKSEVTINIENDESKTSSIEAEKEST